MKIKQQDFHGQIRVGEKLSGSFDFGQGNSIIFSSQEIKPLDVCCGNAHAIHSVIKGLTTSSWRWGQVNRNVLFV